jgi:hypothetical protein
MKEMDENEKHELAEDLEHYTDPDDPQYDEEFTEKLRRMRPDWFNDALNN